MVLCAFGFFRVHVRIAHPIREDLNLAAVFSFRPVDQIHRTERRLYFSFFRVLFHHYVSVTNSLARRSKMPLRAGDRCCRRSSKAATDASCRRTPRAVRRK